MSIWNIFKPNNEKPKESDNKSSQETNPFSTSKEFEESQRLIKEATSLKKNDLKKAIELIEKAIQTYDDGAHSNYIKLANYNHDAGNKLESYSILDNLITLKSPDKFGMYNMHIAEILEKKCVLLYKDKNYKEYIVTYLQWLNNIILAFSCQGRKEELINTISTKNYFEYLAPTKVLGSLKKLSLEEKQDEINLILKHYFESIKQDLFILVKLSEDALFNTSVKEFKFNESIGERSERILKKNQTFIQSYKRLNNNFFNETIIPAIVE